MSHSLPRALSVADRVIVNQHHQYPHNAQAYWGRKRMAPNHYNHTYAPKDKIKYIEKMTSYQKEEEKVVVKH